MDAIELTTTAQLLASQFGVRVELAHKHEDLTAYTRQEHNKTKTIILPMSNGLYREEALSWMRGYLDHEVGHVLFTNFTKMNDDAYRYGASVSFSKRHLLGDCHGRINRAASKLWRTCFNIIEDGRIEQRMAQTYPGSLGNLRWLSNKLFTMDEFGKALDTAIAPLLLFIPHMQGGDRDLEHATTTRLAVTTTTMLYTMRWMLYHRDEPFEGMQHGVVQMFVPAENRDRIMKLSEAVLTCTTQEESTQLANELCDMLSDYLVAEEEHQGNEVVKGLLQRSSPAPDDADFAFANADESMKAAFKWDEAAQVVESMAQWEDAANRAFHALDGSVNPDSERAGYDLVMEDTQEDWPTAVFSESSYLYNLKHNDSIRSGLISDKDLLRRIDAACMASYQVLSSALQTATYTPSRTGSQGIRLDSRFLVRPALGDGRIFTRRAERRALDTNVLILLDASGSMRAPNKILPEQTNMTMALVVAHGMVRALRMLPHVTSKLMVYSSSMFAELEDKEYVLPRGNTPTAGAINVAYMDFLRNAPKSRQVLFVITDGCASNEEATQAIADRVARQGVDVYGLAVLSDTLEFDAAMLGSCPSVLVPDMHQLAPALTTLMRTALVRANA